MEEGGGPAEDGGQVGGRESRRNLALWLYGSALGVYLLDRVTKVAIEAYLPRDHGVTLVPGILQLQFTENPGGAFGLLGGATWLFLSATLVVCAVIVVSSFTLPARVIAVALGLVLGGAVGNLTDRVVRGPRLSGKVVDFLAFAGSPDGEPVWPVFNVADGAIVVGAALIFLASAVKTARSRR